MSILCRNPEVNVFLDSLAVRSADKYEVIQKLREIVHSIYPDVGERIMYGGIMFALSEDFGGIFASSNHVSFEFGSGCKMNDPEHLLEGNGKFRRHLKIRTLEDVADKDVTYFVKQVQKC